MGRVLGLDILLLLVSLVLSSFVRSSQASRRVPASACPLNCSGHGVCVDSTCDCTFPYEPPDCVAVTDSTYLIVGLVGGIGGGVVLVAVVLSIVLIACCYHTHRGRRMARVVPVDEGGTPLATDLSDVSEARGDPAPGVTHSVPSFEDHPRAVEVQAEPIDLASLAEARLETDGDSPLPGRGVVDDPPLVEGLQDTAPVRVSPRLQKNPGTRLPDKDCREDDEKADSGSVVDMSSNRHSEDVVGERRSPRRRRRSSPRTRSGAPSKRRRPRRKTSETGGKPVRKPLLPPGKRRKNRKNSTPRSGGRARTSPRSELPGSTWDDGEDGLSPGLVIPGVDVEDQLGDQDTYIERHDRKKVLSSVVGGGRGRRRSRGRGKSERERAIEKITSRKVSSPSPPSLGFTIPGSATDADVDVDADADVDDSEAKSEMLSKMRLAGERVGVEELTRRNYDYDFAVAHHKSRRVASSPRSRSRKGRTVDMSGHSGGVGGASALPPRPPNKSPPFFSPGMSKVDREKESYVRSLLQERGEGYAVPDSLVSVRDDDDDDAFPAAHAHPRAPSAAVAAAASSGSGSKSPPGRPKSPGRFGLQEGEAERVLVEHSVRREVDLHFSRVRPGLTNDTKTQSLSGSDRSFSAEFDRHSHEIFMQEQDRLLQENPEGRFLICCDRIRRIDASIIEEFANTSQGTLQKRLWVCVVRLFFPQAPDRAVSWAECSSLMRNGRTFIARVSEPSNLQKQDPSMEPVKRIRRLIPNDVDFEPILLRFLDLVDDALGFVNSLQKSEEKE